MNKIQLHQQLMTHLQQLLNNAKLAAKHAHETATSEESIAENQYDTLAIEAAYLAQGQSQRVTQCQANIDTCIHLPTSRSSIGEIGALMVLVDQQQQPKYVLICPVAGGVKLKWNQHTVMVITPQSPMGKALSQQQTDDQIRIHIGDKTKCYDILQII